MALLAFLDSLAPPSELDIAEWHCQLWKACGGKEPCPFLPDDPGPRPPSQDCISGRRQQVQWMAVHQFLRAMSSSAPSFLELLLGLRLCPGPEEQLAYIDQYRPQGTAYSVWAEALHMCLCKSQLLGKIGQEDPTPSGKQVMRTCFSFIRKAGVITWIEGFQGKALHHHIEFLKTCVVSVLQGVLCSLVANLEYSDSKNDSIATYGHPLPLELNFPSLKVSYSVREVTPSASAFRSGCKILLMPL